MSLRVEQIDQSEIQSHHYMLDQHTVTLRDHGRWLGLKNENDDLLCMACVRVQQAEFYVGEIYTPQEFRCRGYATVLLKFIADKLCKGYSVSTHALYTSRNAFERAGFKQYAFRHFKYGDQYWLRRDGEKIKR